jgi:hypothetical protein
MIRALDRLAKMTLTAMTAQPRPAMATDIIKGAYFPTPDSEDDQTFSAYLLHKIIAGVRDLLYPAYTHPTLVKDALSFFLKDLLRGVILSWQSLYILLVIGSILP